MKKGDMSISLVVKAVLAVLVLVLILFMINSAGGGLVQTATACEGNGLSCQSGGVCSDDEGRHRIGDDWCKKQNDDSSAICCKNHFA